ncbi:MAG TPA: hypothetical protein VD978_28950 [Azospirillum sp.]|nr:hypothetical protein [Azospirillum sp.]
MPAVDQTTGSDAQGASVRQQSKMLVAFCLLCTLPLLSDDAVSWVAKGTGADGVSAYVATWSAVAALAALAIAALVLPLLAGWLVRDAILALAAGRRRG